MKHFYVATSKIDGLGIMVGEDVKRGDVVHKIKGEVKFLAVHNKEESLSYPNWIGIGEGQWIDPEHPHQYLNHSCDPSAGIKNKLSIVALRDIKEGEEITIDYSIIEGDDLWEMPCSCGVKKCRKLIRGIQYLPRETFDGYLPFIPRYFQKLYMQSHKNNHG